MEGVGSADGSAVGGERETVSSRCKDEWAQTTHDDVLRYTCEGPGQMRAIYSTGGCEPRRAANILEQHGDGAGHGDIWARSLSIPLPLTLVTVLTIRPHARLRIEERRLDREATPSAVHHEDDDLRGDVAFRRKDEANKNSPEEVDEHTD